MTRLGKASLHSRIRSSGRHLVASFLHQIGFSKGRELYSRFRGRRDPVCVLGLHRVLKDNDLSQSCTQPSIIIREETFVGLLEYIGRHFRVLSLADFVQPEIRGNTGGKRPCLITFDDGWRDNYWVAYPWLKKFGMPALIFLVSRLIGTKETFWVEKLASAWRDEAWMEHLKSGLADLAGESSRGLTFEQAVEFIKHMPAKRRNEILTSLFNNSSSLENLSSNVDGMMGWDQVIEMSHGGIDFGAHTETHPLLVYEPDETVERELKGCKNTIEAKVGAPVISFAYPNGSWDERVRSLVNRAGYSCAFSTLPGWHRPDEDMLTIRRVLLHEGNLVGRDGKFSPALFEYTLMRGS